MRTYGMAAGRDWVIGGSLTGDDEDASATTPCELCAIMMSQ